MESPGGLYIGARRNAENGDYYWRITQWVMPSFTMIAPRGNHSVHGHFWIPIDDEHCWTWSFDYHPTRPLTDAEVAAMRAGKGIHVTYVPGTFRPLANKDNDYLMDRAAQEAGRTYSGVEGFAMQDASLQESMGPIVDRTKETLVSTDIGIIMARQRLLRAAAALADNGRNASRPRPGAPAGALGRDRSAAGSTLQGWRPHGIDRASRRGAGLGLSPADAQRIRPHELGRGSALPRPGRASDVARAERHRARPRVRRPRREAGDTLMERRRVLPGVRASRCGTDEHRGGRRRPHRKPPGRNGGGGFRRDDRKQRRQTRRGVGDRRDLQPPGG